MINERIVKKLKQTNISKDAEKTKTRVYELWKASSKSQKHAVEVMAGISRATIYRVYNTGSISAKLVVPMAQNFNVDPDYLTGKTNIRGECTDDKLYEFLTDLGYGDLIKTAIEKGKKRAAKEKAAAEATEPDIPAASDSAHICVAAQSAIAPDELTLADLHLLMQSLLLREKAGIEDAIDKAAKLRTLLLS